MINLLQEKSAFFINLLCQHLQISFIAVTISCIIGLVIGIIISEFKKSSKCVLGIINFLYTIPSISLLGFLIPFSGIGNKTAIIALSIYALLPMVRNTFTGIENIDDAVIEAATGMGSTRLQIIYKIKLPLAMPIIMSGIRNMVTMTIALAGIASFIGAGGLGIAIYRGITTNNTSMTIIGSLLIAILALIIDGILGVIERIIIDKKSNLQIDLKIFISAIVFIFLIIGGLTFYKNKDNNQVIHLATKPMTEQYIIGAMIKEMIEEKTDINVEVTQGVGGGTSNIQPGMVSGEFDMYPEYTSTGWNMVLKHDGFYNEEMYDELVKEYKEKFSFTWTGILGFNDSYGIAVRKEIADKYNLKTYSDLAKVSDKLVFGGEYDFFERPDGYSALSEKYNFKFKKTMDLDIGLKYKAINEGKVDVMDIFTTDGQLTESGVIVLKDDKEFFSTAMGAMVVRNEVLDEYPELEDVFSEMEGILNDSEMAKLNYMVETEGMDAETVAHEYLVKIGILSK
nr:glycine betaine ABC transporter substrate-binding protein [Romboutsia sp. 1001713B170207_170306_H8]